MYPNEDARGDLDGLLVVSLEQAVAAPYLTRRLADAGARVIKLERREGDFARGYDDAVFGLSSYFVWLNHGKESVSFDLTSEDDRAFVHRMLSRTDVFVQNLAPGAADRYGFGSPALRARYPRLITCDISGYGPDGPFRTMKAYDLLIQAESGLSSVTGTGDQMARVGVSICDIACGMSAHAAVLQALYTRERTGAGRSLEVSLFHSIADWMNVPYLQSRYGGATPKRSGLRHPSIAPYGVYYCARREPILIAVQNEREWACFAGEILNRPGMTTDDRFNSNVARVRNREELDVVINDVVCQTEREELARRLSAAGIAFGRVTDVADLPAHPQARFITVDTPDGRVELLEPPGGAEGRRAVFGTVPEAGQHSAAVRAEFTIAERTPEEEPA
jgi:crotonobetainyl-CoA:carnitine CoA-transferase CaiB-like acyl-CoA transferase